ncbi:hypothetical protein DMENIID0001_042490 [Sergentomyia squamirostris]
MSTKIYDNDFKKMWNSAKPYKSIPGPSIWVLIKSFMLNNEKNSVNTSDIFDEFQKKYGGIFKIPGMFGKKDSVVVNDPKDFEIVYRNEGQYPVRRTLETMEYCRKDKFPVTSGLFIEQGEKWWNLRQKINVAMLKPEIVKKYTAAADEISSDFLRKIHTLRDSNQETPANFFHHINMWALEAMAYITMNRRLGLLEENPDKEIVKFVHNVREFMQLFEELELQPSMWKIYKTSKFVKFERVMDEIHETVYKLVNQGVENLKIQSGLQKGHHEKGILEKHYEIDKDVAVIMAIDSLIAGIDTTSSSVFAVLSNLALNPEHQNILRNEILKILPEKDSPLTMEKMANLPYLRACVKEAMRMTPTFFVNTRLVGRDIVLQGYQIPKGTDIFMYHHLLYFDEQYFPNPRTFMPERWLRTSKKDDKTNPFAFLPFGTGTRSCVGRRLSELKIETLVMRIVRNYHMEWRQPLPKMRFSTVNMPQGDIKLRLNDIKF